jgi:pSer/pThr/pTyr-binding forkhead associated (FHA) protein
MSLQDHGFRSLDSATVMTTELRQTGTISRSTISNPANQLCLNFVGGLCAGRTALRMEKTELKLGRGAECDIVLDGDTVSRVHCRILRLGNLFLIEDTSRNGTYVNGKRIEQAQLNDRDQVRVGQNLLVVDIATQTGTQALNGKVTSRDLLPYLLELRAHIVVKGLEIGVTQPFSEDTITIGRREGNQLVLDGDNISRQHVNIERRGEHYFARDLGSANGTYLNEQRLVAPALEAQLHDGDRLRIGDFELTVRLRNQDCILNFRKLKRDVTDLNRTL